MGDSELSASELRRRYLAKEGGLTDDSLSASQLRARHGIAPNRNWSGPLGGGGPGGNTAVVLLALAALAVLAPFLYYMFGAAAGK